MNNVTIISGNASVPTKDTCNMSNRVEPDQTEFTWTLKENVGGLFGG